MVVAIQPNEFPVTVYVVVFIGESVIVFVTGPFDQVYELAPVAVNVADWPLQIVAEVDDGVGKGFTVIVPIPVLIHPKLFPVTV